MNTPKLLANLEQLDSSLSYKANNPDGTECLSFRGLGDGTWQLSHSGRETTLIMTEQAVKRQLHNWREHCGSVIIFACCCSRCSPPPARELQNQLGLMAPSRITHGYWPDCYQEARAAMFAELRQDGLACGCR